MGQILTSYAFSVIDTDMVPLISAGSIKIWKLAPAQDVPVLQP